MPGICYVLAISLGYYALCTYAPPTACPYWYLPRLWCAVLSPYAISRCHTCATTCSVLSYRPTLSPYGILQRNPPILSPYAIPLRMSYRVPGTEVRVCRP
eukprot:2696958-Rhodomonas_salina.1